MKLHKLLLWCAGSLAILVLAGCASSVHVTHVTKDTPYEEGVYYTLPRTVFIVEVPITNTVKIPGKFADQAEAQGFGTNATKAFSTNFAAGVATLRTVPQYDPENVYRVKIEGHYFEKRSLQLELDEQGVLTSAASEADNRIIDFAVQTLETAGSVAGKVLKFGGKAIDDKSLASDYKSLLNDIQARRFDLITGQTQPGVSLSAEAMRLALDELKSMEKALLEEFTGKTKTKVWIGRFEIVPKKTGDGVPADMSYPLFDLNPTNGVTGSTSTNPVPGGFSLGTSKGAAVTLKLTVDPERVDTKLPGADTLPTTAGYFYRYPAPAKALVVTGKEVLAQEQVFVAQFGKVLALPSSTGSKSSKQQLALFNSSGALKTMTVSSDSWDPAQIQKLGNAASSVIEARDEFSQLERKRKILEEKKKIIDAENALKKALEGEKTD